MNEARKPRHDERLSRRRYNQFSGFLGSIPEHRIFRPGDTRGEDAAINPVRHDKLELILLTPIKARVTGLDPIIGMVRIERGSIWQPAADNAVF